MALVGLFRACKISTAKLNRYIWIQPLTDDRAENKHYIGAVERIPNIVMCIACTKEANKQYIYGR